MNLPVGSSDGPKNQEIKLDRVFLREKPWSLVRINDRPLIAFPRAQRQAIRNIFQEWPSQTEFMTGPEHPSRRAKKHSSVSLTRSEAIVKLP
jgi:hypothetical protein